MAPKITCECGECRKCKQRVYMRTYYVTHADTQRETSRRSKLKRAAKVREYNRIYWRENGHKYRERTQARNAVNRAIRRGDLVRGPCEQKGPECRGRIEAHHDDYGKPLEVRWLCAKHHGAFDQRF